MDPEEKKKFNFGTGEIDTNKWLQDIDSGLEGYYKTYSDYWGQERTAEVQKAMQDLVGRISSGDMQSRSANGTYNFGSQLYTPERNKYTKWAYQTALSYLGNKGRLQITTPEQQQAVQKTKPTYSSQTLLQRFNNSIMPGSTAVDLAGTWWNTAKPEDRVNYLKDFFNKEAAYVRSSEDLSGVHSSYNGLDRNALADKMAALATTLNTTGDFTRSFNELGLTNILKPTPAQATYSSVDEELAARQKQEEDRQKSLYLEQDKAYTARSDKPLDTYTQHRALQQLEQSLNKISQQQVSNINPNLLTMYGAYRNPSMQSSVNTYLQDTRTLLLKQLQELQNNWESYFTEGADMKPLSEFFAQYLHKSQRKNDKGEITEDYTFLDDGERPIPVQQNMYYIPGTYKRSGHALLYDSKNNSIVRGHQKEFPNLLELDDVKNLRNQLRLHKEGGVLKFAGGGGWDPNNIILHSEQQSSAGQPSVQGETFKEKPSQNQEGDFNLSKSENARLAAAMLDIGSMLTAFVPGYGTAASAGLGLGSTFTNLGADIVDGASASDIALNALFGLGADVMGLIPGLGGAGKGAKIAKNLVWFVPKFLQWTNTINGLGNLDEIKASVSKIPDWSSMTVQDWQNVQQALQIVTGHGRSVVSKAKIAGMRKKITSGKPTYKVKTSDGDKVVTEEQFNKLRQIRGTKERQKAAEPILGEGVQLQQTRWAPWNTNTTFGAFRVNNGNRKVKVKNKHKGFFGSISDENIYEAGQNWSGDSGWGNPYKTYYSKRAKKAAGGILKALREGGIIKAEGGTNTTAFTEKSKLFPELPEKLKTGVAKGKQYNWYDNVFSKYSQHILDNLGTPGYADWLNGMQDEHSQIFNNSLGYDFENETYEDDAVKNYQIKYKNGFDEADNPYNTSGISTAYNTEGHYDLTAQSNREHLERDKQNNFQGEPDGLFSQITDDRRLLGRAGDWRPEQLEAFNAEAAKKGYKLTMDTDRYGDDYFRLVKVDSEDFKDPFKQEDATKKVGASEVGVDPGDIPTPKPKEPNDIRPWLMGLRYGATRLNNDWMYRRIYDRIPQPILEDYIDRHLDTIGDYNALATGYNDAANLMQLGKLRQVSDQSFNLAADQELFRQGRDTSIARGRQADVDKQAKTHEAALNMDMDDVLKNHEVTRRNALLQMAYMDRRANALDAWDKATADNNMALVNNLTDWRANKYLEKKMLYDQALRASIPSIEERVAESKKVDPLYLKYLRGETLSDAERAEYQQNQIKYLKQAREGYYSDLYETVGGKTITSTLDSKVGEEKGLKAKTDFLKSLRESVSKTTIDNWNKYLKAQNLSIIDNADLTKAGFTLNGDNWVKTSRQGGTLEFIKSLRK